MLAPSQQKDQKIKQIQKNERKALWTLAVTSQCRISMYKLTGRPAQDGLAQVDYSGRRSGALQRASATEEV
jgi:hypothetical protein